MRLAAMEKKRDYFFENQWCKEYDNFKAQNLKLNMARGKPSPEQLDLSMGILDVLNSKTDIIGVNGDDYRNYGVMDGIPEAKKIFSKMLGSKRR